MSDEKDDIDIKAAKSVLLSVYLNGKLSENELIEHGGLKLMNRVHTTILEIVNKLYLYGMIKRCLGKYHIGMGYKQSVLIITRDEIRVEYQSEVLNSRYREFKQTNEVGFFRTVSIHSFILSILSVLAVALSQDKIEISMWIIFILLCILMTFCYRYIDVLMYNSRKRWQWFAIYKNFDKVYAIKNLLNCGKFIDAISESNRLLAKISKQHQDYPFLIYNLAEAYSGRNQTESAKSNYEQIADKTTEFRQKAYLRLLELQCTADNCESVLNEIAKIEQNDNNRYLLHHVKGKCLLKAKKYDDALAEFIDCMTFARDESDVIEIMETHNSLAECYIARGELTVVKENLDGAEKLYKVFKTPKSKFGAYQYKQTEELREKLNASTGMDV